MAGPDPAIQKLDGRLKAAHGEVFWVRLFVPRREGGQRQGVDLGFHFVGQCGINPPLAFHARESCKRRRDDPHAEMGLATMTVARMALMARAVVDDLQLRRREGGGKLTSNCVGHVHEKGVSHAPRSVKQFVFLFFHGSIP